MQDRSNTLRLLEIPTEIPQYNFGPAVEEIPRDAELPKRFRPPVPMNLLVIRHAPSELNVLNDLMRRGVEVPPEAMALKDHPDNAARLAVGAEQFTSAAAAWIKRNTNFKLDAAFCSPYVRAKETAGQIGKALGLEVRWKADSRIGERSYGQFGDLPFEEKVIGWKKRKEDVRYWTPPNGESLENLELEARDYLRSIASRFSTKNVVAVTHGEFMIALRSVIEYPSNEKLVEYIEDGPPNCGIMHFTRQDPDTKVVSPYFTHLRLVDPRGKKTTWDGSWRKLERVSYSNEELLAEAERHPRVLKFSTRS